MKTATMWDEGDGKTCPEVVLCTNADTVQEAKQAVVRLCEEKDWTYGEEGDGLWVENDQDGWSVDLPAEVLEQALGKKTSVD